MSDMRSTNDDASNESLETSRQIAARIRAAMTYSGLTTAELVAKHPEVLTTSIVRRMCFVEQPRPASELELWAIADGCAVPLDWLQRGWATEPLRNGDRAEFVPAQGTLGQRVGELEREVSALNRYVRALLHVESSRAKRTPPLPATPSPSTQAPRATSRAKQARS